MTGGESGDRRDVSSCCRPRRQRCVPTRKEEPRSKREHRFIFFFFVCCETQIEQVKFDESDARAVTGPTIRPARRCL